MRKIWLALLIVLGMIGLGSTTTVQAAANNKFGITIDGNFDDWKDKPKMDIRNPGIPEPMRQESLLADGDYIYYYVTMSKTGLDNTQMNLNDYEITVGNDTSVIYIKRAWDIPVGGQKKVMLQNSTKGDKDMTHSPAIIRSIKNKNGYYYAMECKIPFSDLGLKPTQTENISMKVPPLGRKVITTQGGSTGPIILAIIGLVIAALSVFNFPKLKKSVRKN